MFSSKIYSRNFCCINWVLHNKQKLRTEFGLNKVEKKHLKRRLTKAQLSLTEKHIYKTNQITTKARLAVHLANNEVYNKGGLIALIKPFGVRRYKLEEASSGEPNTVVSTLNSSGYASTLSIEETLPLLKNHYNLENLEVVFCPERWTSGVMLLSAHTVVSNAVRKCFRRSLAAQQPHLTFWALVKGLTVPEAFGGRVGIHFCYVQNMGKIPLIKKAFSKGEVDRGDVKANVVEHVVLAHHKDNDVSLVEVKMLHSKWHFLRVWLSSCLAPVLGDLIFGGRVKQVLGNKVLVSHHNLSAYQPQEISRGILKKLNLSSGQAELIPVHVHLSKVKLAQFEKGGEDLVITAAPPQYFVWTCKRLALMAEEEGGGGGVRLIDPEVEEWEEEKEEEGGIVR